MALLDVKDLRAGLWADRGAEGHVDFTSTKAKS